MSKSVLKQLIDGELSGATSFSLSDNLSEFPREIFALEETLEMIDLSKNRLSKLPDDFGRFTKLKIAFFSENDFEELPKVLWDCTNLEIIGFKSNRLKSIPENSIPHSVHWLTLTDNEIETLPHSIGNCRLRKVGLAGNKIQRLPDSMKNCHDLELLRISANQLEELPQWLLELPKLRWLAFSGNPCTHTPMHSTDLEEFPWEKLELKELLGQGASGYISRAISSHSTVEEVAVKLFKGEVTSDGFPEDEMAACIAAGYHANLVPLKGKISEHPNGQNGVVLGLIPSQYEVLGKPPTLSTCTRDVFHNNTELTINQADTIFASIESAMNHLHDKGILHGDLYAHNTFFHENGHAILGDFGAATFFDIQSETASFLKNLDRRALECLREDLFSLVPA